MNPWQEAALEQLGAIPGVVGSMVFDASGAVIADAFPEVFDRSGLDRLAGQLAGDGYFQEWLAGDSAVLDLRYGDGQVVARSLGGTWLLILCTAQVNGALLTMSLTQVARRLRASADAPTTRASATPPPAPPPAPDPRQKALDRLRALVTAELGTHAAQALEILAAAGPGPQGLLTGAEEIERLTRMFISRKKADELGRKMRELLVTPS